MAQDLFGQEIIKDVILRERFLEPPFSVLDTKTASWQNRKRKWISKGIKSEIGRDSTAIMSGTDDYRPISKKEGYDNKDNYVSIFDPALTELMYNWFCEEGGTILDPFAGGSVRGIVANYLGFKYTGLELRQEQVDSNIQQSLDILPIDNQPEYYCGDADRLLDNKFPMFDMIFSCPPYANLEVYSDLPDDLSNMGYKDFSFKYHNIIQKALNLLNPNCYAVFVVGDVRDKNGNYIGFVADTIKIFQRCGAKLYNEAILLNVVASASMRANGNMKTKKLVKIHQNVLVFKK